MSKKPFEVAPEGKLLNSSEQKKLIAMSVLVVLVAAVFLFSQLQDANRDDLELDGSVEGQGTHSHGGPRVNTGVAEDGGHQLRGTVDDLRLPGKSRGTADEPRHPDDAHAVQVVPFGGDYAESVEGTQLRCCVAVIRGGVVVATHSPATGYDSVCHRQLPGNENQIAGAHRPGVSARRRRRP